MWDKKTIDEVERRMIEAIDAMPRIHNQQVGQGFNIACDMHDDVLAGLREEMKKEE